MNYYQKQLLNLLDSESIKHDFQIQVVNFEGRKTKWMNIDRETSIKLMEILEQNKEGGNK